MNQCATDLTSGRGVGETTGRFVMVSCHHLHPELISRIVQLRHMEERLQAHRVEAQDNQPPVQEQPGEALVHREPSWWKRLGMGLQKIAS